jgi:hypothetical protein
VVGIVQLNSKGSEDDSDNERGGKREEADEVEWQRRVF